MKSNDRRYNVTVIDLSDLGTITSPGFPMRSGTDRIERCR